MERRQRRRSLRLQHKEDLKRTRIACLLGVGCTTVTMIRHRTVSNGGQGVLSLADQQAEALFCLA
jgi:hypothetical protein